MTTAAASMLSRRKVLTRILGTSVAALAIAACRPAQSVRGGTSDHGQSPKRDGTLRLLSPYDLVPAAVPHLLSPANFPLYGLVYETLISYNSNSVPRALLAADWQWSSDFRQLTLHLRPDVRFHTGRPFSSMEAKLCLERLADPGLGSQWLNYAQKMEVSAPDPGTLVIRYDTPSLASFDVLAGAYMVDPDSLNPAGGVSHFSGTGPFTLDEWQQGHLIRFARNPAYWQSGRPYLDTVSVSINSDVAAAQQVLEGGAADWLIGAAAHDAVRLSSDTSYQVLLNAAGGTYYYLGFDLRAPGLSEVSVRRALSYALNRERMVDVALSGLGRAACTFWPRQSAGYDSTLDQAQRFDLHKARDLLHSAGWRPSEPVNVFVPSSLSIALRMAQIYQSDLASLGIHAQVHQLDTADFVSRFHKASFGGLWLSNAGLMNLSPATFLTSSAAVRIPNGSNYSSERYAALVSSIEVATDTSAQKALLGELTQLMLDDCFVAPIAEGSGLPNGPDLARATVRNIAWNPFGVFDYHDVWLDV